MREGCREADRRGRPSYLFSSDPANETFYHRFGYVTKAWIDLPREDWEPPLSCPLMIREVGAAGPGLFVKKAAIKEP